MNAKKNNVGVSFEFIKRFKKRVFGIAIARWVSISRIETFV